MNSSHKKILFVFSSGQSDDSSEKSFSLSLEKGRDWIYRLLKTEGFDTVVAFSTTTGRKGAKALEKYIEDEFVDVTFIHEPLQLENNNDYQECFDVFRQYFEDYSNQYPSSRFSLLLNTGSRAMQACWLLLSSFRKISIDILQVQEGSGPAQLKRVMFAHKDALSNELFGPTLEVKEDLAFFLDDLPLKMGLVGSSKKYNAALAECFDLAEQRQSILFCGEEGVGKKTFARLAKVVSRFRDRKSYLIDGSDPSQYKDIAFVLDQEKSAVVVIDKLEELPMDYQKRIAAAFQKDYVFFCTSGNVKALHSPLLESFGDSILRVPSLSERIDDIPQLVRAILDQINLEKGIRLKISNKAMKLLVHQRWPDNLQGLYRTLESAALVCETPEILPEDLGLSSPKLSKILQHV